MGMESPDNRRKADDSYQFNVARDIGSGGSIRVTRRLAGFSLVMIGGFMGFLIVFLGAGIGGALRHGVNLIVPRMVTTDFPLHTLIINVVGSLAMGLLAEFFALRGHLPQEARLFLTTGILGGFTTFSAFSLETALMIERGALGWAAVYVFTSIVLGLAGLFIGLQIIRIFPS